MMKIAKVNKTYSVLNLDEDGTVIKDVENESSCIDVDQYKGDDIEVWKEREDGFLFVYCNRLEIGYWVIPSYITIKNTQLM